MIRNHTAKRFLTTLLISVSLFGQSLKARPRVTLIENESEYPAHIKRHSREYDLQGTSKKQFSIPLFIPFISIDAYRDEFIAGDPYFPTEALTITTKRGMYGIWRDETGIVYALHYAPGIHRNDCIPVTIIKKGNEEASEKILQALVLLVTINKHGDIKLQEK